MSLHSLHTRIDRLEARTVALGCPTGVEVMEASARLAAAALAAVDALLQGHTLPVRKDAQEEADRECIARWERARGLPPVDVAMQAVEFDCRIQNMIRRVEAEKLF